MGSGAAVIPIQPMGSPSRYGEDRRPNIAALIASLLICGIIFASLFTMKFVALQKEKRSLTVVEILAPPVPPPPPPQSTQQPDPAKPVQMSSPVVAPQPLVQLASPPAQIATSPVPAPVEVSVPGPPAPAPAPPAAPAVENAGDLSSKMISATPPRYPQESRRKREQGTVVLMVLLGIDGKVTDISVSRSSGFDRLDQAALSAVRRWRWSPTRRGGAAVMVKGLVEIPFVLQDK